MMTSALSFGLFLRHFLEQGLHTLHITYYGFPSIPVDNNRPLQCIWIALREANNILDAARLGIAGRVRRNEYGR